MDEWMGGFVPVNHISIESAGNLRKKSIHEVRETKAR
jgi:hypothetical protein